APDVMILDRRLPDGDGIDMLRELRAAEQNQFLVIVVTAYGDVENAVEALQAAAVAAPATPVQGTPLLVKPLQQLEAGGLRDALARAKTQAARAPRAPPKGIVPVEVLRSLDRVSQRPLTPVFLVGPSGAGKQYAAELLHRITNADQPDGAPFVEVNC